MESNIQKIQIESISYEDFTSKNTGKEYTRCIITTTNGTTLSGFKSYATEKFKNGDVVELKIEKKVIGDRTYYNFKTVRDTDKLEEKLTALTSLLEAFNVRLAKIENNSSPVVPKATTDQAAPQETLTDIDKPMDEIDWSRNGLTPDEK